MNSQQTSVNKNYSNVIQPPSANNFFGGGNFFGALSQPPPTPHTFQQQSFFYPQMALYPIAMVPYTHKQVNHPIYIKSKILVPNSVVGALIGKKVNFQFFYKIF